MKYVLLSSDDADELSESVQSHLDAGWELHGDTRVAGTAQPTPVVFMQAMIKRASAE